MTKVLIAGLGTASGKNGYDEKDWCYSNQIIKEALGFFVIAQVEKIDYLIILGTEKSFQDGSTHYNQFTETLKKYNYEQRYEKVQVGSLNTKDDFWEAFKKIVSIPFLKQKPLELYIDLTFGYRTLPMLTFLSAYYLDTLNQDIHLKKLYYCMDKADPPEILDMTEIIDLLQWITGAQMFVSGGSAVLLLNKMRQITGQKFGGIADSFENFTDAYAFNYVSYLPSKAREFENKYNLNEFKSVLKNKYPQVELIQPYLERFIRLVLNTNKLEMHLDLAEKNYVDRAYSRSVIILREAYITCMMKAFGFTKNKDREEIEKKVINSVYWTRFQSPDKPKFSEKEIQRSSKIEKILITIFGESLVEQYFSNWGRIRTMRNAAGHIKNIQQKETIDFMRLKDELKNHIQDSKKLFKDMRKYFSECIKHKDEIKTLLNDRKVKQFFIIVNEGLHPILPSLFQQYGEGIRYKILTTGNVGMNEEMQIAGKVHQIALKNDSYQFYVVPSGYPYLAVTVYNVLQQTLSRHPIWLQYDRESNQYLEKNLDPRYLIANHREK